MSLPDFDELWNYDDPQTTELKFRQLLPAGMANRPYHIELLTQIARTQGLQRNFDEAHKTLDEAEQLLAQEDALPKIRCLLERGRIFNSSRQPDQSRPLFLQAWELAKQSGEDALAVDAAHMLAIVEPGETSLKWNRAALELAERSSAAKAQGWKGSLYNNIGWTFHDRGDYQKALEYFEAALKFRLEQGDPSTIRVAHWSVARALRSLGRVVDALEIQEKLLDEYKTAGLTDGFVYEELAECCLALNRAEDAHLYFRLAYNVLSQDPWLAESEPARLQRLKDLSTG